MQSVSDSTTISPPAYHTKLTYWPLWKLAVILTLNVWGLSYLGLTRSVSLLLMPWLLRGQGISSHDIDYVEYVGPGLTWGRILSTCVVSMWSYNIKCKYIFMFPLKNFASKELRMSFSVIFLWLIGRISYRKNWNVLLGLLLITSQIRSCNGLNHYLIKCWPRSTMQYDIFRQQQVDPSCHWNSMMVYQKIS